MARFYKWTITILIFSPIERLTCLLKTQSSGNAGLNSKLFLTGFIFILTFAMFLVGVSQSYADMTNSDHKGFYLGGTLGGLDIPTGPDEKGFTPGFNGTIKAGYQFTRFLAIESDFHQSIGLFYATYSPQYGTQITAGSWSFMEYHLPIPPVFNLKFIIPLNSTNNLYIVSGVAYDSFAITTINTGNDILYSAEGFGYNAGMGYESYRTDHISLGGEVIYHSFVSNKFSVIGAGMNGTVTTPYILNMSFTSLNFMFLYHF